ncbi:MAG: DUF58 domain-containing protein [Syntrophobacteraceae bacterium]
MLISGIFGRRNIYGIEVEVLLPQEVYARTETPIEIKARNRRKWAPAFLISVEACGKKCFFAYIAPNATASGSIVVTFEQRGALSVPGGRVSSNYPFNFFERFRRSAKDIFLTVYPRPVRCSLDAFREKGSRLKGERELNKQGYDSDILSIRDYAQGDPPKYISWKSTAKTGSLKVKELSAIDLQQVIIDFDGMDKKDLEKVLSCTTFAVIALLRSGIPVGLRIRGEALQPDHSAAHRRAILTRLAVYGQS